MNSKPTFFKQFQSFASNLEGEVSNLKKEFEAPAGTRPKNYYNGLKVLKSEMEDLQKFGDDIKGKMYKVHQFSYFVQSSRELIREQDQDITRMEKYLEKYGYEIPQFGVVETSLEEEEHSDEKLPTEVPLPATTHLLLTPELSEIGRRVAEGKDITENIRIPRPVHTTLKIQEEDKKIKMATTPFTTPVQRRKPAWYCTPNPNISGIKKVKNWLRSLESEADLKFSLTKSARKYGRQNTDQVDQQCYSPSLDQRSYLPTLDQRSYLNNGNNDNYNEREVLPSFKKILHQDQSSVTPEEPVWSVMNRQYTDRKHTPEEPQLSDRTMSVMNRNFTDGRKNTPEEPQLSDRTMSVMNRNFTDSTNHTPDEPVLTDRTMSVINKNCTDGRKNTPEEPLLSDRTMSVMNRNFTDINRHTPEEPLLSDRTMSVMNRQHTDCRKQSPEEPQLSAPDRYGISVVLDNTPLDNTTPEDQSYMVSKNQDTKPNTNSYPYPYHTYSDELPESPKLSDITQKILNIKTLRLSDLDPKSETEGSPRDSQESILREKNHYDSLGDKNHSQNTDLRCKNHSDDPIFREKKHYDSLGDKNHSENANLRYKNHSEVPILREKNHYDSLGDKNHSQNTDLRYKNYSEDPIFREKKQYDSLGDKTYPENPHSTYKTHPEDQNSRYKNHSDLFI